MRRQTWPLLGLLATAIGCTGAGSSKGDGSAADVPTTADAGNTGSAGGGHAGAGHAGAGQAGAGAGGGTGGAVTADAGTAGSPADAAVDFPDGSMDVATPPGPDAGEVAAVQYYGRWDFTGGKAITVYSGSHVTARFQGTGISARLDLSHSQNPVTTVTWQVDGGAWMEGDVKATMVLATGLPAGMHEVVFMARGMEELFNRWNPPVVAALSFSGFDVTGGALVPTARPVRLKIEFVGDSLTEGVRVVPDGTDPQHTNGRLAYPCLTANAMGAEWRQVGFGHQGILQTGHGNVPKAADSFDWVYATVPRDAWVADMVVLNQGTNDRDASSTAFRPEFARYLGILRKGYPQAKIFVLRTFGGYREADIAAEVAARIAAGDTQMFYVDTTGWLTAADYTEGLHPNIIGHQKATTALVAELRKHL
jgi:GDSL-like Lipase/Acylhydrolase family/Carbohydrate esterase 2 N-terminal